MSKILVSIDDITLLKKNINKIDGCVIGIKGYSINYPSLELDKVKKMISFCNKNNKEIYIVLNKNIHNNEIDDIKKILLELNNINGLFYYDNGIITLKNELNLKYDLVWDQEHQVTNYMTINNYNVLGIKYAHLSTDITLKEMKEIRKNTKSKLIVTVFGYLPMFSSYRHLVKNYLNKFNLKDNSSINYMRKEGNNYIVIDNELGTFTYTDSIYSILDSINSIKDMDYILLNGYLVNDFGYVLDNINDYKKINEKYDIKPYFKNKETIYKVK